MKNGGGEDVTPVYLRSVDHSWIPALQLNVHPCGTKATVAVPKYRNGEDDMLHCAKNSQSYKYNRNETVNLNDYPNKVLPMQNVDCKGNLEDFMDMVDLPFMHEVRHKNCCK